LLHSLRVEVLAEPQDLLRAPEVSANAGILVTNHWRAEYPPAPRVRLVQSVATGIELIDLAALPRGVAICNAFGRETSNRRIRADGDTRLEPSLPRDRGRFSHPLVLGMRRRRPAIDRLPPRRP
jgi:hypothetical protein